MKIIDKKEFATAILNKDDEIFVVYMAALSIMDSNVHPSRHAQIALLEVEEVTIPFKCANWINVFSSNFTAELFKHTSINNDLSGQ